MKKILFVLIILALFLLPTQVFSLKIQAGDSWTYTDNLGNTFHENTIGSPYDSYGANWASVSINTSRPFPFQFYNYSLTNVNFNGKLFNYSSTFYFQHYSDLEVSQLGGIPLASRNNFTAIFTLNNLTYHFTPRYIIVGNHAHEPNMSLTWLYGNTDPQNAIKGTTSASYSIMQDFMIDNSSIMPVLFEIQSIYQISSLSNDKTNFTCQYQNVIISYTAPNIEFHYSLISPTLLALDKVGSVKSAQTINNAYSFILPNSSYVPTIISQTQPVPNAPNISPSAILGKIQATQSTFAQVVYTLQKGQSTQSIDHTSVNGFELISFVSLFIVIVIYRKKKAI